MGTTGLGEAGLCGPRNCIPTKNLRCSFLRYVRAAGALVLFRGKLTLFALVKISEPQTLHAHALLTKPIV